MLSRIFEFGIFGFTFLRVNSVSLYYKLCYFRCRHFESFFREFIAGRMEPKPNRVISEPTKHCFPQYVIFAFSTSMTQNRNK